MALKPQDVLVLLKAAVWPGGRWHFHQLAVEIGISASEVHSAVRRCVASQLIAPRPDLEMNAVQQRNLIEFVLHGLKYVFPAQRGGFVRGMPTAQAAPVLAAYFAEGDQMIPVWPDPEGAVLGVSFEPLYRSVPFAAKRDANLYSALALVDAIRGGRARDRAIASDAFRQLLGHQ